MLDMLHMLNMLDMLLKRFAELTYQIQHDVLSPVLCVHVHLLSTQ